MQEGAAVYTEAVILSFFLNLEAGGRVEGCVARMDGQADSPVRVFVK